jgi:hypothetical protein
MAIKLELKATTYGLNGTLQAECENADSVTIRAAKGNEYAGIYDPQFEAEFDRDELDEFITGLLEIQRQMHR